MKATVIGGPDNGISDVQVCLASECAAYLKSRSPDYCQGVPKAADVLGMITGQNYDVCVQAIKRAHNNGYVWSGNREWLARLQPKGAELIARHEKFRVPFTIETFDRNSRMVLTSS